MFQFGGKRVPGYILSNEPNEREMQITVVLSEGIPMIAGDIFTLYFRNQKIAMGKIDKGLFTTKDCLLYASRA